MYILGVRTWIAQPAQRLCRQTHIGVVHAHAGLAPPRRLVLGAQHARRVHRTANVYRVTFRHLGERRTVQRRQGSPLRALRLRSRAQLNRTARRVPRSRIGQVERLDARQAAVAQAVRRMGGHTGQLEALGLVLDVGRRWRALLFLLHSRGSVRRARIDAPPSRACQTEHTVKDAPTIFASASK
jgi:hypothetical protein